MKKQKRVNETGVIKPGLTFGWHFLESCLKISEILETAIWKQSDWNRWTSSIWTWILTATFLDVQKKNQEIWPEQVVLRCHNTRMNDVFVACKCKVARSIGYNESWSQYLKDRHQIWNLGYSGSCPDHDQHRIQTKN